MDYFKIRNLKQEPFSNSPDPEFFFASKGHLSCLQQLEIAIRLRRGLNVVLGDVGTGKTTLCRQLIRRFSESEEDRNEIETHLLLDPSFGTPSEFLAAVAAVFGIAGEQSAQSEWQLKEAVKNYLFQKGVDESKTVVLIIDEGQKLPEFGREILRELLNYDTNEKKLLQIVIFAQNEFREILKEHPNFADRVNQCYLLGPLNFRETQEMIRFRLVQAGHPADGPRLFTRPALWAIYRMTGGFPRRMITLCHHILLAMIIRNRQRAGWLLVLSARQKLVPKQDRRKRWSATTAALTATLFLSLIGWLYLPAPQKIVRNPAPPVQTRIETVKTVPPSLQNIIGIPSPAAPPADETAKPVTPATPAEPKETPGGKTQTTAATAQMAKQPAGKTETGQAASPPAPSTNPAPPPNIPSELGRIKTDEGDSIPLLLREIYGSGGMNHLQAVIRANPHISDVNRIRTGETISLPAIPTSSTPLAPDKIWVQMAKKTTLENAHRLLRIYPPDMPPIRLVPYWNPREGMIVIIVLKTDFSSAEAARKAIEHLPTGAKIMEKAEPGSIYFAN